MFFSKKSIQLTKTKPGGAKKGKRIRIILLVLPLLLIAFATVFHYLGMKRENHSSFLTSPINRTDILSSISATGTLEPEEVIDVGAQVAGRIVSLGRDADTKPIDYGSIVEKDMVLAFIDDTLYAAQINETKALVKANKAALQRGQATLQRAEAELVRARLNWIRAKKLGPNEALAGSKYDKFKSEYEIAVADITVCNAEIEQAKATLAQSEAALSRAQINYDYCTIKSPVRGVIIDRRVDIGQTVVASLNTPSLFLLAKDLKQMEIWVAMNEADIAKIKPGGPASFTVTAFPGKKFMGQVENIRLNASMTQNVVSYIVVVKIDNQKGHLLPYLTANVTFELERRESVLTVPNSALSWEPTPEQVAPEFRVPRTESASDALLWTPCGPFVCPAQVQRGVTDGIKTEVEGVAIYDKLEVVTGVRLNRPPRGKGMDHNNRDDTRNPFATKMPRGPGGGPGGGPPG